MSNLCRKSPRRSSGVATRLPVTSQNTSRRAIVQRTSNLRSARAVEERGLTKEKKWAAQHAEPRAQKINHFAKFSTQRPTVHSIDIMSTPTSTQQGTSVEDYVFHMQSHSQEMPELTVRINDTPLKFCVVSGADAVIGETWQKHLQTMQLEHTTIKLGPDGVTQEIPVMGKFSAT